MGTRPDMKGCGTRISAIIIYIIAAIMMTVGAIIIIIGLIGGDKTRGVFAGIGIIYGLSAFVISAFLFIVANISDDLHWSTYLTKYYGEENVNYHEQSLELMRSIASMLYEGQPGVASDAMVHAAGYPPQSPQWSGASVEYSDMQTQETYAETPQMYNARQMDYSAQYKRPLFDAKLKEKTDDKADTEG